MVTIVPFNGRAPIVGNHFSERYSGSLTRWAVHRRHTLTADNGGGVSVAGNVRDVLVEGCTLKNPRSTVRVDGAATG